jgi:hypothetical protein
LVLSSLSLLLTFTETFVFEALGGRFYCSFSPIFFLSLVRPHITDNINGLPLRPSHAQTEKESHRTKSTRPNREIDEIDAQNQDFHNAQTKNLKEIDAQNQQSPRPKSNSFPSLRTYTQNQQTQSKSTQISTPKINTPKQGKTRGRKKIVTGGRNQHAQNLKETASDPIIEEAMAMAMSVLKGHGCGCS